MMATILVVEDNDDVREMMSITLQLEGHNVVTAANGRQALEVLHRGTDPCMILLDLMMPVMNGWQFQEEVAKDPKLRDIPVVIVSAAAGERGKQTSAAAFIPKPIDVDKLLDVVCEHCPGTPRH
jgi:CheY-like chemotaxis protein